MNKTKKGLENLLLLLLLLSLASAATSLLSHPFHLLLGIRG
jgi:hypothetical protein